MSTVTDMKTHLQLSDARVSYPDGTGTVTALDGVSLAARSREMTAIIGESGSGKSTLLSVAAALTAPDAGEVTVAGERVEAADETERARIRREHIGFIFQQPNLVASLNARDQLLLTDPSGVCAAKHCANAPGGQMNCWDGSVWVGSGAAGCTSFRVANASGSTLPGR